MYVYSEQREALFTESGQRLFMSIRDRVKRLLHIAGAVRLQEAISGETGSGWEMIACMDRMVELGELIEITGEVAGQYRVFIEAYR